MEEKRELFLFYGHKGAVKKACFSQWFIREFVVDGVKYCCMEQYMMAQKAWMFRDVKRLSQILSSKDPAEMKALGREVEGFDPKMWDEKKREIVYKGNLAKFSQNEDLKGYLLETGDKVLVEASPYDKIWGIGLRATDPRAKDPKTWLGQNLLGYALTRVKETLQASEK